ncbi:outer membrane protein SusC, starch binding [Filimonas lacunae]|nr:outer membrane protein SusC, starch binding [Filimonas lacunae]
MLLSAFLLLNLLVQAQNVTIKGKVIDDKGNPVSSVSIKVKSTNASKTGGADGTFSISAPKGDVLIFSSVGYTTKEVVVGNESIIDVTLATDIAHLNDVVVIGYGKASKKTLSSAVTTVKPEDLNKGVISDVGQLLQGKVPGLNISSSGDPNKPAAVVLRGASSINSPNGPFYVIDGVPGADITTIAPDDIASVDVLKDAAATAIYGNKAASGVIMVTTKKGKKGAAQTSYNGSIGRETVSGKLKLMDGPELKAYLAANGSTLSSADDKGANTDWMKAIQRDGAMSQNHNLSVSGGGEKSTYSASINYLNKEGILQKSKLNRIIGRIGLEHLALNDKAKFTLNVSNSISTSNSTPLQNNVLQQAAIHLPTSPVRNADGSYFENFSILGYFNPVSLIDHAKDDTKNNILLASFITEIKLPLGLTYNVNLSYQKTSTLHGEYYDSYYSNNYKSSNFYSVPDPALTSSRAVLSFGTNGTAIRSSYENSTKNLETFLTWDRKIGAHSINAVVGYSYQQNLTGDGLQASNTNFRSDYTGYQNLALGYYQGVSGYSVNFGTVVPGETKFISDFARLNYSFQDKYLLQASIRRDGSSVFGTNNQWGYFPSVSLAWRMKQENFLKDVTFINDLKLRASYGQTGNALGFGAYTAQRIYTSIDYTYDAAWVNAIGVVQAGNPNLKWEKTATTNLGVDFSLFNNLINGSIDVYDKVTTGMIFKYQASSSIVPGGAVWGNGGKMSNKGIELSLSSTPVKNKNFSWTTTLNLASNKNRVVFMDGPAEYHVNVDSVYYSQIDASGQTGATLQLLTKGAPLGEFFTLKYAGKNASGTSQFVKKDGTIASDNTVATRANYRSAGSPQPKLLFGFTNTFRYKNLDVNLFIRGTLGQKIFNATRASLSNVYTATTNNISVYAKDDKLSDVNNLWFSDRYVENGSYVRFDNLTVGYNIKLHSDYVRSIRVYSTVNNLAVITSYKGVDPEVNMGGVSPGVDYNNFYPKTRTIMLGAMINF